MACDFDIASCDFDIAPCFDECEICLDSICIKDVCDIICPIDTPDTTFTLYSNDGSTVLYQETHQGGTPVRPRDRIEYRARGMASGGGPGLYVNYGVPNERLVFDMANYSGLAYSPNATVSEISYETEVWDCASDVYLYVVGVSPTPTGTTLSVTYNSTKIIDSLEITPPVTVTYNGSTIATLNEGDTKTLQCNGKVMASDVVIGGKTLQCNGKLMASDVVVEVGGVTPTGETWVLDTMFSTLPNFTVNFESNGTQYVSMSASVDDGLVYRTSTPAPSPMMAIINSIPMGYEVTWASEAYRTITLDSPATGDFLTWLQANAIKQ